MLRLIATSPRVFLRVCPFLAGGSRVERVMLSVERGICLRFWEGDLIEDGRMRGAYSLLCCGE